jgi:hypothetical protein
MRATTIHHIETAEELAVHQAAMTSAVELVLGHLLDKTFYVEIADELVAQFWKLEELCSRLEQPSARICDLLLMLLVDQVRWANHLDEPVGWLEALWTSATRVWDLVLDNIDGPSFLVASLSMVVSYSRVGSTPRPLMESDGGPDLCWLPPCHIF